MKLLVACEESQVVTVAFRKHGVEAYSCDIIPCSGKHLEWHIQGDVRDVLNAEWDAVIAFPPCTHLCSSGARWFKEKQADGRQQEAIDFFMMFATLPHEFVAIENPVGIMSTKWRKPDQIIQPWRFGHGESKSTCLWLRGFPLLRPTKTVPGRREKTWLTPDRKSRSKDRSKTYSGIAKAMGRQWAPILLGSNAK